MNDDSDHSQPLQPLVCQNCGSALAQDNKFCATCGQKNTDGRITFRQFIADFFEAAFNLDSRLIKTIPALLVPGKLTRVYFGGKHNSYFKPLRLFFTTMIVFYAVLGFKYLNKLESRVAEKNPIEKYGRSQFAIDRIDTIVAHLGYDTLTEDQQTVVDTIVAGFHTPFNNMLSENIDMISLWGSDSFDISASDLYTLSVDSILNKYNVKGFLNRLTVQQAIVLTKSPGKVLRFLIGNTTWMIIVMLPVLAGFMQLIYIRRKTYFIEHLIFLYHYHAAVFVVMTLYLLLLPQLGATVIWIIPLSLCAFFLVALKLYYQQGWLKTLLKFGSLAFAYLVLIGLFGALTSVISFFLYQ